LSSLIIATPNKNALYSGERLIEAFESVTLLLTGMDSVNTRVNNFWAA